VLRRFLHPETYRSVKARGKHFKSSRQEYFRSSPGLEVHNLEKNDDLMIKLLCLAALCWMTASAQAATYYVRSGATGSRSGTDWSNAYTQLPSQLERGSLYYVADGTYGSHNFNDGQSGNSRITVQKATVQSHGINTGWADSYGDGLAQFASLTFGTGFYTFDGATGGGPGSWESGFGFKVRTTDTGKSANVFFGSGVSEIAFRHTDFEGRGRSYGGGDTDLFYLVNKYLNISISHCYLHDTDRTMILSWPSGGSGFLIEYSKFARNGNAEHREAWSAGTDSNVTVRHSLFEDIMGTGVIAIVNNSGDAKNWNIYGNIFYWTGKYTDGIINTGAIFVSWNDADVLVRAVDWNVYNNVFANIKGYTSAVVFQKSLNSSVHNNIWYNNDTDDTGVSGAKSDYNWFYGNRRNNKIGPNDAVGTANPFTNWQGGDWRLALPISGLPLTGLDNKDYNGVLRGADGVWDRGALEYSQGAVGLPAPTNLRVQ
jgi:hypothetical protein